MDEHMDQARLIGLSAPFTGQQWALSCAEPQLVGRGSESIVRLPHSTVSRLHAELTWQEPDSWLLLDLDSANGTAVNGQPVKMVVLQAGDEILFGEVRVRFSRSG